MSDFYLYAGAILLWLYFRKKKAEIPDRWIEPVQYSIYLPVGILSFESKMSQYSRYIMAEAEGNGVEAALIAAIIGKESRFDANKVTGRFNGLMQIGLSEARSVGYLGTSAGLLDAVTNIKYGTRYLKYCIDKKKDVLKGVSGYNTGRVERKDTPYNAEYVNGVLSYVPRMRYLLIQLYPGYGRVFPSDTWIAGQPDEISYI